ncbi:MAG: hypothetical protein V1794_00185 [Candidatus Glassbacteria bacterium]
MDYFIKILDVIIWPSTVIFFLLFFRREFSKIISRLSTLRYRDFEASFNTELKEAEQKAVKYLPERKEVERPETLKEKYSSEYEQLKRIADVSPRAAIIEAWRRIEVAAVEIAKSAGIEIQKGNPVFNIVRELTKNQIFSEGAYSLYDKLRQLRNKAAHADEIALESVDTDRYIDLALELEHALYQSEIALGVSKGTIHLDLKYNKNSND